MTGEEKILLGSIAITGNKITALGDIPKDFKADLVIDATGMIAMPGLVNAHTHLSMTYFRNYRDSYANLYDWLQEIWKLEAVLKPADIYPSSLLGAAEMILSGTTCFADMYFFPEGTAQAAFDAKLKANIGLTLFGEIDETKNRINKTLPVLQELSKAPTLRYDIAPHAIYTCSEETLRYAVETVRDRNCRLHIHASETQKEVTDSLVEHGKTPLAYLDSLGAFTVKNYIAHGVHPTATDYELINNQNTTVVHNPSSNCKLASGIAPIKLMADRKVQIALGTDGASSNNTLDMFQEIRLAAMLSAVSGGGSGGISPYQLLEMATIGGARALGREAECGTLEIAKDADIILLDTDKAHLTPLNNLYSALVFAATSSDVDTVFCRGQLLMQHRVLQTIDIERTIAETNSAWKHIKNRT